MDQYRAVHCLFCETGKEPSVVRAIQQKEWGRAIFAQRANLVWKNHERREELAPLFPSYVFVYTDRADAETLDYRQIAHVIHPLQYEDGSKGLVGSDLAFAEWLWRQEGRIGVMKAVQAGEKVEIVDRLFQELHGTVIRMNRTRKKIHVALKLNNVPMKVLLSYEVEPENGASRTDGKTRPGD